MDPESIVIREKWYGCVHSHHVGIGCEGQEDSREDGKHLHGLIELVREERVVGIFQGFDRLFLTLKHVPEADIGTDQVAEIHFHIVRYEWVIFLDERFDDGALRFERAAEIQDVALQHRDLEHHLLLFSCKDLFFYEIEFLADMVEPWETGIEQDFEQLMKELGGGVFKKEAAFSLAFFQRLKKASQLVDALLVAGDQVVVGQDDVEFAWVGRAELGIEKGDVHGKEQAAVVLDDFRLIGRRHQLFDSKRVNIEVLLEIGNIILIRIFKINPCQMLVLDGFHSFSFDVCFL